MPRIPRARRRRIPSGQVGEVPTPMDIADVGAGLEAKGLGALGRGLGDLGQFLFRIQQDQQRLIDFEADSRASALMTTTNDQINTELLATPNTKEEGQPSAYEQVAARIYDENITKFFEETQMSKRWQGIIQAKLDAGKSRAISSALFTSAKKSANTAWAALEIETIDAYASMDTEQIKEAKEKFEQMWPIRFGESEDGKAVAGAEWDSWVAAGQKAADEAAKDAYRIAALAMGKEGIAWVIKPENTPGISQEDRFEIQKEVDGSLKLTEAIEEEKLEAQREVDRDVIGDATNSGTVPKGYNSIYDLINKSSLDEDEQHQKITWAHQEADRRAKGTAIIRDDDVYDKLDDRIIDYHLGTETKKAILSDLREARFGDKPTIPQKDYEDLKGKLQTEFTKLNAGYLKEARAILRDAIVTDTGLIVGQDKDEKLEFRAIVAGLEADIRAEKYEGEAILTQAFAIAERYAEDPIGRAVERMRKFKEQAEEMKERMKEVPRRGASPASKVREWLKKRGAGD